MINTLLERFNSLSTREKIISLSTLLVLFWGIWDNLIYQPITTEQKRLNLELTNLNNNLTVNQQVAIQLEALGKIDPNKENKQSLKKIKLELKKLKLQLETGNKKFVPAHLMTEVLQDMLRQNKGLKLISLKTLAITTLSENKQLKSWIYRHGLSITLSGSYFNTLKYLKSLESSPWRFNWESINYQVKQYPEAETTFRIYTLSFEENWLGL